MKVHELIAKLSTMSPDAEVVTPFGEHWDLDPVEYVGYDPENPAQVVLDDLDDRWQCDCPKPYRETSAMEKQMQQLMAHVMHEMAKAFLNQPHAYDLNSKVGSVLTIRKG